MRVLVAGANGKTGFEVVRLLKERGHEPVAMIRNAQQRERFEQMQAETLLADLERREDFPRMVADVDAAIFAAGSGPKTGPDKTLAVDLIGAIRLIDAAEAASLQRFIMLSSINADPWSEGEKISHYQRAKGIADFHLQHADVPHTIVRPGGLTNDAPTGKIKAAEKLERATIPRADVAAVLVECLDMANTVSKNFAIVSGATPIPEALAGL